MHALRVFVVPFTVAVTMSASAQDFSTPEAAFREHQQAFASRDVQRFLATIEFRQEAIEQLQRASKANSTPSEAAIAEVAATREAELRGHLENRGFRPATLDACEVIAKWQDSDNQVRFPLTCKVPNGSNTFPVRLMRFPHGWRVVRGG